MGTQNTNYGDVGVMIGETEFMYLHVNKRNKSLEHPSPAF